MLVRSFRASVTPVEEALSFAQALQGAFSRVLGGQIAGVILHGSLTSAEYVSGFSDVDLLIIIDEPLSGVQLAALTGALEAERRLAPARRADLRVVTRQVAAAPTPRRPWRPTSRSATDLSPAYASSAVIGESAIWWSISR